jgi:hypothetical protein
MDIYGISFFILELGVSKYICLYSKEVPQEVLNRGNQYLGVLEPWFKIGMAVSRGKSMETGEVKRLVKPAAQSTFQYA